MNYKLVSEKIRAFAATLVEPNQDQGETMDREVIKALQIAFFDSIRDEWQHFLDAQPELKKRAEIAKVLMADNGYGDLDPICGVPGVKPYIAKVDDKEAVCFDYSMGNVTPLSAIFANKVSEVMDAAAKVEATQAQASKKALSEAPPAPQ